MQIYALTCLLHLQQLILQAAELRIFVNRFRQTWIPESFLMWIALLIFVLVILSISKLQGNPNFYCLSFLTRRCNLSEVVSRRTQYYKRRWHSSNTHSSKHSDKMVNNNLLSSLSLIIE
ncbi:hypothetical protein CDAR_380341 [Caerostris darwini]|uniref:Uncharacterized protein n=1 Tax=Caerostris darwini TaxID=1538125 RepID=A0AAV4TLG0_9ARAC|nr:hypothetical protein CDAR_380341 [Caerostris darwini]